MYSKKRVMLSIYLIIVIILSTSCSSGDMKEEGRSPAEPGQLRIDVLNSDRYLSEAVDKYNRAYSDVPIEVNLIADADYENYKEQVKAKILSGQGPDIFCSNMGQFASLYKAMENSMFCDLNPLIENRRGFELKDYFGNVLDCGVYKGKRYLVPVKFVLPYFMTTKDILDKNNLNIDDEKWTWKDVGGIVNQYMRNEGSGSKERYFFAGSFDFGAIVSRCMTNLVDYDKKKTNFNSQDFIDLLGVFNGIYNSTCKDEEMIKYKGWHIGMMKSGVLAMVNAGDALSNINVLWGENTFFKEILGSDMEVLSYPSYTREKRPSAAPRYLVGISGSCKYKNEAFRLIEILLSREFQTKDDILWGMPVNREAYTELVERYTGAEGAGKNVGNPAIGVDNYKSVPIPAGLADKLGRIIENMGRSVLIDEDILKFINDEVKLYLDGKKNAAQTAKALDEKVTLFLNE
jgi:multiple sugar transport system substrate-binding protein